ncbi:MAG: hypothetical protein LBQ12_10805 [Deltaproteobacteria bacterium]|nr:hypothetical protein [Deltaproteobacteria bacterium]
MEKRGSIMEKIRITILPICSALVLLLSLAANGGEFEPAITYASVTNDEAAIDTMADEFNSGPELQRTKEYNREYEWHQKILKLSDTLNGTETRNVRLNNKLFQDKSGIFFKDISSLVNRNDDRTRYIEAFFCGPGSNKSFIRSSTQYIKGNVSVASEDNYSRINCESFAFENAYYMLVDGVYSVPDYQDYGGGPFFVVEAGSEGNMPEGSDDDDLAYWNGFDFGPNLSYAEEYKLQGDPGDYLNPAEAAKATFDGVKIHGYIPGYSDSKEYTMTLVDLADLNGEECYVYRCDGGGFAAGFAYAYQSGTIYMQGQGGQWVPLAIGDGDPNDVNQPDA